MFGISRMPNILSRLFVDLNSYFASVEQQEHPELRGRPVAVVPVEADTSCCIAASYEAKAFGVRTGTLVREARRLCPGIVLVHGRHGHYIRYHHEILAAAETVLPVDAVHSIDEFSIRLLGEEREPARAVEFARRIKAAIRTRVGECMRSSIGIAPNRFLAKVASDMQKPDGLVVIEPKDLPHCLHRLELIDLPGIGPRMEARLVAKGVTSVERLTAMAEHEVEALWGSVIGRWWYHWLRGDDWGEMPTTRRSIGHQHVLEPRLRTDDGAHAVTVRLLHKAAARARSMGYWARRLVVFVRCLNAPTWNAKAAFHETNDTLSLVQILGRLWARRPEGVPFMVGAVLEDLANRRSATLPLFEEDRRRARLSQAMDRINLRGGRDSIYLGASHAALDSAPTRIAFNHIPDLALPETSHTEDEEELEGKARAMKGVKQEGRSAGFSEQVRRESA